MAANAGAPINRSRASVNGGALGFGQVIDAAAASYAVRRHTVRVPLPTIVTNATTNHSLGVLGIAGNIVGAFLSYRVVPLVPSGTATYRLATRTADGVTQAFLTASANLLTPVALVPRAETLTAVPDLTATQTVEIQIIVSNNAPTQGTDGWLVLVIDPNEPTVTSQ